jgi:hypothetical protein
VTSRGAEAALFGPFLPRHANHIDPRSVARTPFRTVSLAAANPINTVANTAAVAISEPLTRLLDPLGIFTPLLSSHSRKEWASRLHAGLLYCGDHYGGEVLSERYLETLRRSQN